jgi:hypothetical protein
MSKEKMVVLRVVPSTIGKGWMDHYQPQIATASAFESFEQAARCNVGTYPEAKKTGKPYRVVVVPLEHWHEFEVYAEQIKGQDQFKAYPSEHPTFSDEHK